MLVALYSAIAIEENIRHSAILVSRVQYIREFSHRRE